MSNDFFLFESMDADWDIWIRRAPFDFYHLANYHRMAEEAKEGKAYLAVYGSPKRFFAWPYLTRKISDTYFDATSVYGYAAPTGLAFQEPDFILQAWDAFRDIWRGQGLVTMFIRLHPILSDVSCFSLLHGDREPDGGELLKTGRSVSIDLTRGPEIYRMGYSASLRRQIRKSRELGVEIFHDGSWSYLKDCVRLYAETMRRAGAVERYLFTQDYFEQLRAQLPGVFHLSVALLGGECVAAFFYSVVGEIAQMHLNGANDIGQSSNALKALVDACNERASHLGAARMHLGAGRGGFEDSLFEFKTRFAKPDHDFVLGRWILNAHDHDLLMRKAEGEGDRFFFPRYRATPKKGI